MIRLSGVDFCLRNARILRGEDLREAGVAIEDGKIASVSKDPSLPEADTELDLGGAVLLPGVVDPHVHFRDPGLTWKENFYTGSAAAVAGGVTTVCDMPNNSPLVDSLDRFREKGDIAGSKSLVDFGLHAIPPQNSEERKKLLDAGVVSFKLYPDVTDDSIASDIGDERAILSVHPEDPDLLSEGPFRDSEDFLKSRPREAEISEVKRIINLNSAPHLHFCHVTLRDSLNLITHERKNNGVTCEVTPHHLLLDSSHIQELGSVAKINPPLRKKEDNRALLRGLKNGTIDILATDHAPHTREEKDSGIVEAPPGIAGIETSLPLLFTMVRKGRLPLSRLVEVMCEKPAKLFDIRNEHGVLKGTLREGADADLVALDQNRKWTIKGRDLHGKTKFTPFEGWEVTGKPFLTIVRGEIVFKEGEIVGKEGHGRFIPRQRPA